MADEETKDETQEQEATETTEEKTEDAPAEESKDEAATEESASSNDSASGDAGAEEAAGEDVEIPEKFQTIVSEIENMSVIDLNELVKLLEKKFGVSAAAAAAPAAGGGDAGGGEEEKSAFTVELTEAGENKINVIKIVKNALGLGLKEAKDMVENLPATLKEDMPKEDAEQLKSDVEEAGGSIELK